jgi:hypothetical protein
MSTSPQLRHPTLVKALGAALGAVALLACDGGANFTSAPKVGGDDATGSSTAVATGTPTNTGTGTDTGPDTTAPDAAPTVELASLAGTTVSTAGPFQVMATFSEPVTGFGAAGVVVTNGKALAVMGTSPQFTVLLMADGPGRVTVQVKAEAARDGAGQANTESNKLTLEASESRPGATLSSTELSPTSKTPIPVTATFTMAVTGFEASDLVVTNGAVQDFAGSGKEYTFQVVPTADGEVEIKLPEGVAESASGAKNTAAEPLVIVWSGSRPVVQLTTAHPSPTNQSPATVTAKFSKAVTGFTVDDLELGNATASGLAPTDLTNTEFTFKLHASSQGEFKVKVVDGAATDESGNTSLESNELALEYLTSGPTVTLASPAPLTTNVSPIPVTAEFSRNVTGFVADDVTVTNGTVEGFAGAGKSYAFNVVPSGQGVVTVTIAANVANDAAGNGNSASAPLSRTYDTVMPDTVLSSTAPATTNQPIPVKITFSEPVTGFVEGDITITGGTPSEFAAAAGGMEYTVKVTPNVQGQVTVEVAAGVAMDAAGNPNKITAPLTRLFDNVRPNATLASTAPATGSNPAIPVTLTFSEAVTGLAQADLTVTNGAISAFAGSGASYSFTITATAEGPVKVSLAANKATDAAGNGNTAAPEITRTYQRADIRAGAEARTSYTENSVWVVNSSGVVTKIILEKDNNYPTTTWSGARNGGHRTFVSEIGLLIGANAGYIMRAAADVPTAGQVQQIFKADADSDSRTCVSSFKDDATGVKYIGAIYTKSSRRKFVRIPIKMSDPTRIDAAAAQVFDISDGNWGYSCYTDQGRKILWGKNFSTGGAVAGVNVLTGAPVPLASAPNGAHTFSIPGLSFNLSSSSQSYAMAGGGNGLVLSAPSHYTSAYDPAGNVVMVSNGSTLKVIDAACFTNVANCAGRHWSFNMDRVGLVQPLSSLNDGRVLGLQRGGTSSVFLISLVNPADPSQGLKVELVKDITGDAYMYTDFTGATSYARTVNPKIDLRTAPGFDAAKPLLSPKLSWKDESNNPVAWTGLTMDVRCYKSTASPLPAYTRIAAVPNAGTEFALTAPSCTGVYDTVDVLIQGDGSAVFSKTARVDYHGEQ